MKNTRIKIKGIVLIISYDFRYFDNKFSNLNEYIKKNSNVKIQFLYQTMF